MGGRARARVGGRGRPVGWVAAAAVALVAGTVAGTVARASQASVDIRLGSTTLTYGVPTAVWGNLVTSSECLAGRTVEIQARDAAADRTTLVVTTTDRAGRLIPTEVAPDHTGDVRAIVAATDTCPGATSDAIAVTVAALVLLAPPVTEVQAGTCATLTARVVPAKPGTTVHLQGRSGAAWVGLGAPVLDDHSTGSASWCFDGWGAIGPKAVRAWWPSQDGLNAEGTTPETTLEVVKAPWMRTIDAAIGSRAISVSVREAGRYLYRRRDGISRTPASNEKLLLSMALLERVEPEGTIATWAKADEDPGGGIIDGDLWLIGRGDPAVGTAKIAILARRIADAGVVAIEGRVMGSTSYFARDRWAPGWRDHFPEDVIAQPTALTYRGNWAGTGTVAVPELRAARQLKRDLQALGVEVTGKAGAGLAPANGLHPVAAFRSSSFRSMLTSMNVDSRNLDAEVLNKLLAVRTGTKPGTIAGGAQAIEDFAAARGVTVTAYDGSGLSYSNRATAGGLVILLGLAEAEAWGEVLADSLATPGRGTLEDRLSGVPVKAKTGTLDGISALSGYVWLERLQTWAEFSILGAGISKSSAIAIEDRIVRTLSLYGR